jgi:glycosidase
MLTWGKLAGLGAEIRAQTGAEGVSVAPQLELVHSNPAPSLRESAVIETPLAPRAPTPTFKKAAPGSAVDLLSLRIDPSQVRRSATPNEPQREVEVEHDIEAVAEDRLQGDKPWAELLEHVTEDELLRVRDLCRTINPKAWDRIFKSFCEALMTAQKDRPEELRARDRELAADWYASPWYVIDPRCFNTPEGSQASSFDDVARGLEHVRELGFLNVLLLPHYGSDGLDSGTSVIDWSPARTLGGEEAFRRLMEQARSLGLRVATSAPLGAVSLHHPWFAGALEGDRERIAFFVRADGEPDDRVVTAEIGGAHFRFLHGRHPFQVTLDLRSPAVLREVFFLLGREANEGVLGKSAEGAAGWSTDADALLALMAMFLRLLGARQILLSRGVPLAMDASRALRESLRQEDKSFVERKLADHADQAIAMCLEHPELGERNADLFGDAQRIALATFCLYMTPSTPVVHAGVEIGEKSSRAHAELKSHWQERYLENLGCARPASCDPELLYQGAISAAELRRKTAQRTPPIETLRSLNALRETHQSLAGLKVVRVENSHKGVLSWVKSGGDHDAPLLLLANLSSHTARLSLPLPELRHAMRVPKDKPFVLADAFGRAKHLSYKIVQGRLLITIAPLGFLALEASASPPVSPA